ncbi:MAG: BA14K family protein [Allorhizobium sp.]
MAKTGFSPAIDQNAGGSGLPSAPAAAPETDLQLAQILPPPWYRPSPWYRPPPPPIYRSYPPTYRRLPPPPPVYYRLSSAHVRWCMNRYRSYNPRTDTYFGYDGRFHRCNSPYR